MCLQMFLNENYRIPIPIRVSLKFIPRSSVDNVDNKPAIVQVPVMAYGRRGDKPLSELKLTQFTDAHMRH